MYIEMACIRAFHGRAVKPVMDVMRTEKSDLSDEIARHMQSEGTSVVLLCHLISAL